MKKLISVLLALVSVICVAFSFVGCGNNEAAEKGNVSPVTDAKENSGDGKKLEAGKFYTVTEAYESGYLTREDVMSIAYYHNRGNYKNEEIMGENFVPLPKTPETPSEETDKAIIDSFYDSERWNQYNCAKEDLVYLYYGIYGNAIVLKMGIEREPVYLRAWEEKLDDVTIYYRDHKRMLVFIDYSK